MFIRGVSRTEDVTGLVLFEKMIYLICSKSNRILSFFNNESFEDSADEISIDNMENPWDITCSEVNRSLYISDKSHECVWNIKMPDRKIHEYKIDGQPRGMSMIDGQPRGMSITKDNELLLVVYRDEYKQYSLDIINSEDKTITITIPTEMSEVWQAIRLFSKNFMISHQEKGQHSISEVSFNGETILRTFGLESTRPERTIDRKVRDDLFIIDPSAERVFSLNTKWSQETKKSEIRLMINQYHLRLMMRLFLIEKMKKEIGGHWLKLSLISPNRDDNKSVF